jgi:hypothetical protein
MQKVQKSEPWKANAPETLRNLAPPGMNLEGRVKLTPTNSDQILGCVFNEDKAGFTTQMKKLGIADAKLIDTFYDDLHRKYWADVGVVYKPFAQDGLKSEDEKVRNETAKAVVYVGDRIGSNSATTTVAGEQKETTGKEKFWFEIIKDLPPQQQEDALRALGLEGADHQTLGELAKDLAAEDAYTGKSKNAPETEHELSAVVMQGVTERMLSQIIQLWELQSAGVNSELEDKKRKEIENSLKASGGSMLLNNIKQDMEQFEKAARNGEEYRPSEDLQNLIRMNAGDLTVVPRRAR